MLLRKLLEDMGLVASKGHVSVWMFAAFVYAVASVGVVIVLVTLSNHHAKTDIPRPSPCLDVECADFHRLLNERWPPDRPRGAVVLLIGNRTVSSSGVLFRSFAQHFDENFNNAFDYPVIIFHESDVDEAGKLNLRSLTRSTLYFQRVDFRLPPFINASLISTHCDGLARFGFGYRHMCRFHAMKIYDEPILASDTLDYIWRLDDDSLLTKPVKYDVFRYMREHRLRYGYVLKSSDSSDCVYGLEDAVQEYCENKKMTPSFVWRMPTIVYNNFEVSDVSLWRSTGYRDFIDFIDSKGGIFYHRWGDAPIKSLAVSLLLREDEVHQFNDIGYSHQGMSTD